MGALRTGAKIAVRFLANTFNLPLSSLDEMLEAADWGQIAETGDHISAISALNQSTVYACVRLLSGDLARHPRQVFQRIDSEGVARRREHPVERLMRRPNPIHTPMRFWGYLWTSRLLWGNSYVELIRSRAGQVVEMWPLNPARVEEVRLDGRTRTYVYRDREGKEKLFRDRDILHDAETVLVGEGLVGVSPIRQLTNAIALGIAAERNVSVFLKNFSRPSLIVKHPGHFQTQEQREDFLKRLKESWGGRSAMGIGLLEDEMDVEPLGMPLKDAEALGMRRFQKEEIAQVYGVPMHRLADQQQRAQTSVEQNGIDYVRYTLAPLATSHEQELERALFSEDEIAAGFFIRHNLGALERGLFKDQVEGLAAGVAGGLFKPNEGRDKLDLPPVDGGDVLLVPSNNVGILRPDGIEPAGTQGGEAARIIQP